MVATRISNYLVCQKPPKMPKLAKKIIPSYKASSEFCQTIEDKEIVLLDLKCKQNNTYWECFLPLKSRVFCTRKDSSCLDSWTSNKCKKSGYKRGFSGQGRHSRDQPTLLTSKLENLLFDCMLIIIGAVVPNCSAHGCPSVSFT